MQNNTIFQINPSLTIVKKDSSNLVVKNIRTHEIYILNQTASKILKSCNYKTINQSIGDFIKTLEDIPEVSVSSVTDECQQCFQNFIDKNLIIQVEE